MSFKDILERLLSPKKAIVVLSYISTVIFAVLSLVLALINTKSLALEISSYLSYAVAFLSLAYSTYLTVVYAQRIIDYIKRKISATRIGKKLLSRYDLRTMVFASFSATINTAFVVVHVVLAFLSNSPIWYGCTALYYASLALSRLSVLLHQKNKSEDFQQLTGLKRYRTCGVVLSIIPLFLLPPILQIIFLNKAFNYEGLWIFVFALYAFLKITSAIVNVVKSSKQKDVTVKAMRSIGLADAMVSVFSLQTALLYTFSEGGNYGIFNVITGGIVCGLTISLGIYMIINSTKKINEIS